MQNRISKDYYIMHFFVISYLIFIYFSNSESASANQVIQKKNMKMESMGRVTDIRIENFDLSYGSK